MNFLRRQVLRFLIAVYLVIPERLQITAPYCSKYPM